MYKINWKLFLFVVFAFVFVTVLAIIQITTNIGFEIIVLPQFAPALAYLLTILLFKDLFKPIKINFNKIVFVKAFIAIIFPLALFILTCCIGVLVGIDVKLKDNLFSIIIAGLIAIIIGATAEEIGWRSFFQPTLEQKYSVLMSSLIVGFVWGIWHIAYFRNGIIFMSGFLIFTISYSIIIAFLLRNTQFNIIISSLFHVSINIGFAIFFTDGFTDGVGNIKLFLINGFVWLIAAIVITLSNKNYYLKNKYE